VDRKIKSALDEKLPEAFGDFMEQVLGPYLEEHVEKRFDRLEKKIDDVSDNLSTVESTLVDHQRRIKTLEGNPPLAQ